VILLTGKDTVILESIVKYIQVYSSLFLLTGKDTVILELIGAPIQYSWLIEQEFL